MKGISLFFTLILCIALCSAQDKTVSSVPKLSYFESPVQTQVTITFSKDIADTLRLELVHVFFSRLSSFMDTVLTNGTRQLAVSLTLDHAGLLSINVNDAYDKLFVIPGIDIEVVYEKIEPKKIIKKH